MAWQRGIIQPVTCMPLESETHSSICEELDEWMFLACSRQATCIWNHWSKCEELDEGF